MMRRWEALKIRLPLALLIVSVAGCDVAQEENAAGSVVDTVTAQEEPVALRQAPRPRPVAGSVEERLADAIVAARVQLALADDEHLRNYDFGVDVVSGRVYLAGHVVSNFHRERAEGVAATIEGVEGVTNELTADEPLPEPDVIAEADEPAAEEAVAVVDEPEPEASVEATASPAPEPEGPSPTYHTVRSGESLWTIARQYGTTVAALQRMNEMSGSALRPGQRLRVQ